MLNEASDSSSPAESNCVHYNMRLSRLARKNVKRKEGPFSAMMEPEQD